MSEVVRPSTLASQPIGEASHVVEGVHQLCFALAETLAHLEYLVNDGRAERLTGGDVVRFRAS